MASIDQEQLDQETLVGLLLTGDAEVYQFAADLEPTDFVCPVMARIAKALMPYFDYFADAGYEGYIPAQDIAEELERQEVAGEGANSIPLSWFAELAEKAVTRTNAAIDKLENHRVPLTLRESVSILVCKVKLASAHRQDAMSGNAVFEEIFALDFDRLTTQQMVDTVMQAGGAGAEYLGRFKEASRSWVVSVLLEKAGERVLVEA